MNYSKSAMDRSRLVLGTVQLGMDYGVANTHGAPAKDEAFAILDAALKSGINTFDTAAAYGRAEETLGEWIEARGLASKIFVVSKLRPNVLKKEDPEENEDIVRAEIERSLKRLRVERLDGYLLHRSEDIHKERVISGLQKAKDSGFVANIGVSVYDVQDAVRALALGIDYIQVPYNALDQRLDRMDFFELAKKKGITVFARSPFLQGLLLMEPEKIPGHLSAARPFVERFKDIAGRYDVSTIEAALLFVYAHHGVDHVVFGVETLSQLQEISSIVPHSVQGGMVEEMKGAFSDIPDVIRNPSLWNRKK